MGTLSAPQLVLLRHSCGLSSTTDGPPTRSCADSGISLAANLIARGAFVDALQTVRALNTLLDCRGEDAAVPDAASYYSLVEQRALATVRRSANTPVSESTSQAAEHEGTQPEPAGADVGGHIDELEAVLVAGVACLHIFMQYNLTGPSYSGPAPSPLGLFAPPGVAKSCAEAPPRPSAAVATAAIAAVTSPAGGDAGAATDTAAPAQTEKAADAPAVEPESDGLGGLGTDSQSRGDRWAQQELELDGEDVVGRLPAVQWLLLARRLLVSPLGLQEGHAASQAPSTPHAADSQAAEVAPGTATANASTGPAAPKGVLRAVLAAAPSWPWWALRCVLSHQHALDGRSHTLLSEASQLIQALVTPGFLGAAPQPQPPADASGSAGPTVHPASRGVASLGGVLHLEMALCQYAYGYVDAGRQYLARAGQLLGLEPQLTGALGKRTVHQVDPKAQLVVVANEFLRAAAPYQQYDRPVESLGLQAGSGPANRELEGLVDESDVFPAPVLVGEDGVLLDTRYSAPEQALLLGWATAVKKGTSADELQEWQMAPWVEAVLSQPRAVFMTAAAARLQKTRHERTRGRTKERALLHMDQLAEAVTGAPEPESGSGEAAAPRQEHDASAVLPPGDAESASSQRQDVAGTAAVVVEQTEPGPGSGVEKAAEEEPVPESASGSRPAGQLVAGDGPAVAAGQRAVLCWAVWFPLQVSLRREAAEHYVSMGLVGAAIRVFESLELWDSAITCYRLIGKKALAEELIRRRLAVTPDDPRLWCALGDLHLDDRYYEEAWQRSGQRHTRSQRSLARSAMRKKDYTKAARHWETALALNPLHPEAWFSLGFCHLKAEHHREALRAFTRVTQQEPDNGEAWNNIAALWMYLGGYKPAYAALCESTRHKRDSWQTWENYARAALASGHYPQAVRGLQNCLRLSSGQRLFVDVVSGLLDVLEGRPPPRDGGTSLRAAKAAAAEGLRGVAVAPEGGDRSAQEEAAGAADEDASLKEDEAALGVPLLPLLSDVPLRLHGAPDVDDEQREGATDPAGKAASESAQPDQAAAASREGLGGRGAGEGTADGKEALLSGRDREVVLSGLGSLLREAINSPAAAPPLWGCLGRYWALRGELESAKEARLKQVRGLATGAFKSDAEKFAEYAEASEALARCYLDCFKGGRQAAVKDLAAGRMHLRGLLRATAETFADHPLTAKLQALLDEITKLEDEAIAAAKAAKEAA